MEYILKGNIVINSESEASTYKEIIDGSPRGVYANLSALQTAFPTGTSGVYLTSDDGHWHYWNGTAWADGGVYQAVEIVDGSVTPEKTNFVIGDGINILNPENVTINYLWERQYGTPSTIYKKNKENSFCYKPIFLKKGKKYYTTSCNASNTILLEGMWNENNNSYTGTYYRANNCSFVSLIDENPTGYGKLVIEPLNDCYLFFSSTTISNVGDPNTAMVYEGDSLPNIYKEFNIYENLEIPNLKINFNSDETIVVGKNSNMAKYKTIQEACNNANDGDTILILPGEYYETVTCITKEINIVGISKEKCVLWFDSDNYVGGMPLSIAYGSVQNITIKAVRKTETTTSTNLPYAVHIDYDIYKDKTLKFDNVNMIGGWQAACGIGLKSGFNISFRNCNFITDKDTSNGALFFHDNKIDGYNGTSNIEFDTCNIINKNGTIAIMPTSYGNIENITNMRFVRNCIFSSVGKNTNSCVGVGRAVQGDGWRQYNNFFLTEDSFGNNVILFNK